MTRNDLMQQYWRYYLILEKRFIETIAYVELNSDNYIAYSNNYALLIQAIGAELDTLFKLYCGFAASERKNIFDYVKAIDDEENFSKPKHALDYPFREQEIIVDTYGVMIQPFKDWDSSKPAQSLKWWDAFDKLKHNRFNNRKLANQENTLNILAALFFVEMKYLKKITEGTEELDVFDTGSELFTLKKWSTKYIPLDNLFGEITRALEKGEAYVPEPKDV